MTRDFLKPQKTSGLDTNAPVAKQSPFASRPFARIPRPEMSPQDIQTMRERAARIEQLGNPMRKAWANTQPTVQRDAMPEEEKEENLQMKAGEAVQREEIQEEETLQTKSESTIQRQELEEEDETLQTKAEPTLQREELPEEEETVQTKLTIGQPGDKYEQEADNMAAQVMSMPDPTAENVQRQETEEETLQQKPLADGITPVVQRQTSATQQQNSASQGLESQLTAEKGSGSPLSDEVRGFMEPRFGADFSEVRVHTGSAAVQMNQQLGAQAFTHGNDIYYGKGKAPGNDALTAHELTHVAQQASLLQPKQPQIQCDQAESKQSTSTRKSNKTPYDAIQNYVFKVDKYWGYNQKRFDLALRRFGRKISSATKKETVPDVAGALIKHATEQVTQVALSKLESLLPGWKEVKSAMDAMTKELDRADNARKEIKLQDYQNKVDTIMTNWFEKQSSKILEGDEELEELYESLPVEAQPDFIKSLKNWRKQVFKNIPTANEYEASIYAAWINQNYGDLAKYQEMGVIEIKFNAEDAESYKLESAKVIAPYAAQTAEGLNRLMKKKDSGISNVLDLPVRKKIGLYVENFVGGRSYGWFSLDKANRVVQKSVLPTARSRWYKMPLYEKLSKIKHLSG